MTEPMRRLRLLSALWPSARPLDIAGLVAFRALFGGLMAFASARFLWNGWVDRFFVKPSFFFHYWGMSWVKVLPPAAMHAAFWVMLVASVMVAVGFLYRPAIITLFVVFTYVELIDVSNYLNHYYLVSLLAFLMAALPLNRAGSLDALLWPTLRAQVVPAWCYTLLRCQVGAVYFYAGLAKLNADWLLHGQPLNIWLTARIEAPLIGPYLHLWWVAVAMSWAGFLNDLLMPFALSWRRSRPLAYAVVVVFHVCTGIFFNIGMFPFIMVIAATTFFDPSWPRRLWPRGASSAPALTAPAPAPASSLWAARLVVAYCVVQLMLPLRAFLYGGDVSWHEQGMRWSWRVMLREKNGAVTYRVKLPGQAREREVSPRRYLTAHQEREMSGQPDLILQLGQHIGAEFAQQGFAGVEVRVDALVSLNGRPAHRLIDPDIDLMQARDGLLPSAWILPAPPQPPVRRQSTLAQR
jgi:vitamin K-dependent gamma-carboxylase